MRDLVFDPGRDLLYATAGSAVHRYNPATGQMLAPLDAGVLLKGLDITPDGSAVYSAGGTSGSATLVRIDLPSGAVASQRLGDFREGGYDVAIDATGRGLLTSETGFTNQLSVREFSSGGIDVVNRGPRRRICRNAADPLGRPLGRARRGVHRQLPHL